MLWYMLWYMVYDVWSDMLWYMAWYGMACKMIYDMVRYDAWHVMVHGMTWHHIISSDIRYYIWYYMIYENHVRTLRLIYYWRFPIFELSSPKVYLHRVFYRGDAVWESVRLICFEIRFWKRCWAMYGLGCCNILVYVLSMHFLKYKFSKQIDIV